MDSLNKLMIQVLEISIEWRGPFKIHEILKGDNPLFSKIGLYQIYGDHPINGSDNLLYIGQTGNSFKARLKEQYDMWIKHESTDDQIYVGKLWGDKLDIEIELLLLKESEKLLIYYCSPPYNSACVYDMYQSDKLKDTNVMVLNLWQKHRLPYEVSTRWYNSDCWESKRELLKINK